MTASRLKRLGKLEQLREEQITEQAEALTARAMERLTPDQLERLGREMDAAGTPEYAEALERLRVWGEQVPAYREAPNLGDAAREWWERVHKVGAFSRVPVANAEAAEQFEEHAAGWLAVSELADCPEPEAARGQAAAWIWWAALARGSREPF